jgi:hypothetical protein
VSFVFNVRSSVGCGGLRRDHTARKPCGRKYRGQDHDALLVTDSESLQLKAMSMDFLTEKRLQIDMDLLQQDLPHREYSLV